MFGFIRRLFGRERGGASVAVAPPPPEPPVFHALVKRGVRHDDRAPRWRWQIRDADKGLRALCPPYGFETADEAKADALAIMPGIAVYEERDFD